MVASFIALGREAGDSKARAVLWPHMLVTAWQERAAHPDLAVRAQYTHRLCPALSYQAGAPSCVSVWRWVCASVSG